jgi:murein DD-endopeptidase MepM/ murein hydrolase activator NlpD
MSRGRIGNRNKKRLPKNDGRSRIPDKKKNTFLTISLNRNKKKLKNEENLFKKRLANKKFKGLKRLKLRKRGIKKIDRGQVVFKHKSKCSSLIHPSVRVSLPLQKGVFWVSSPYGIRRNLKKGPEMHHGVDMAAISGTSVYAALGGTVSFAGVCGGFGNCLMIEHGNGVVTRYAHLKKYFVEFGSVVRKGQKIAVVGSTGNTRGIRDPSHLHFELIIDGQRYNPMLHIV